MEAANNKMSVIKQSSLYLIRACLPATMVFKTASIVVGRCPQQTKLSIRY